MKHAHDPYIKAKKIAALVKMSSITIDQAVQTALASIGGTVVDAKLKERDHRVVWRIKLLTAGGRVKVLIDGRSGKLLEALAETESPAQEEPPRVDAAPSSQPLSLQPVTM